MGRWMQRAGVLVVGIMNVGHFLFVWSYVSRVGYVALLEMEAVKTIPVIIYFFTGIVCFFTGIVFSGYGASGFSCFPACVSSVFVAVLQPSRLGVSLPGIARLRPVVLSRALFSFSPLLGCMAAGLAHLNHISLSFS